MSVTPTNHIQSALNFLLTSRLLNKFSDYDKLVMKNKIQQLKTRLKS